MTQFGLTKTYFFQFREIYLNLQKIIKVTCQMTKTDAKE